MASDYSGDSLERIERLLAIEEALLERIRNDYSLSSAQREALIQEVEARVEAGDFPEGDDWDDGDALAILVRRLGPEGPRGRSGASIQPDYFEDGSEDQASEAPLNRQDRSTDPNATSAPG